ncbi:Regulator of nucleoside diphosphate kinase [compost metagenome]
MGENEHRLLTATALTNIGADAERTDFLLYELDRAQIVRDALLPADVVRIGSIVRYKPLPGEERTVKLVVPQDDAPPGAYRLAVTSEHGAALLGLRPGHVMAWLEPDGKMRRLKVLQVTNPPPADDPGPSAA